MAIILILKDLEFLAAAYLIGAIPFCYIISKIISGKNLTEIGDKNPGGWNLAFNVSKIWGVLGIILDVAKGWAVYFLILNFLSLKDFTFLNASHNQLLAMLAGVAAVAGHNYAPYLKFKGGKGIATFLGFLLAVHPLTIPIAAAAILAGLFWAKNMIWAITFGIICSGVFLYFFKESAIYLIMILLLVLVMIPKQINRSLRFSINFKFRKEKTVADLFTPKIR
ncbi:MAG TPA: glycerol-3-phosphate acyltransferase [Candidatus Humimicrobiaceae bacterium]